ncbi:MAG: hypothetical protein ABIH23_10185, partial [bacterium]
MNINNILDRFRVSGALAVAQCRRHVRLLFLISLIVVGLAVLCLGWPMDINPYLRVSSSGEMLDRSGRLLYGFLNEDENWSFVRDLDEISPR